jgi:pimeloyl-ACP methyl ester carboxylesterase
VSSRSQSLPSSQSFTHNGRRIAYRCVGDGPKTIVLTHGLLMDARMYTKLAPVIAAAGHRVVLVDMLGHGASDQPHDMADYSMPQFGRDVIALLDHLEIDQAVIGGASLGANVALEAAVAAPERVRALVVEMPVLEHGLTAAGVVFVPLALAIRMSQGGMRLLSAITRRVPRSLLYVDVLIDFVRRDPAASLAVLDGITFGRVAPPAAERRTLEHRTLVIGHRSDPIHPFGDADTLAAELPGAELVEAKSILEWRLFPGRLNRELIRFLDRVWAEPARHLTSVPARE